METLTRFEVTRLVSARALQLSLGAPPLIKVKEGVSRDIAREEFEKRVLPLSVLRRYPDGTVERVDLAR